VLRTRRYRPLAASSARNIPIPSNHHQPPFCCATTASPGPGSELRHHGETRSADRRDHQPTLRFLPPDHAPCAHQNARSARFRPQPLSGPLHSLNLSVERKYDPQLDLFCFAGEIPPGLRQPGRQLDRCLAPAPAAGPARPSRNWKDPLQTGIRFTVADTGAGMEPEVARFAFEASSPPRNVTGTGLGLWISPRNRQQHHG